MRFRPLLAVLLVAVVSVPTAAVCADGPRTRSQAAQHDCCPMDDTTRVAPAAGRGMAADCCAMSGAATPGTLPAPIVTAAVFDPINTPLATASLAPSRRVAALPIAHPPGQNVPRYLRLSALLV